MENCLNLSKKMFILLSFFQVKNVVSFLVMFSFFLHKEIQTKNIKIECIKRRFIAFPLFPMHTNNNILYI